MISRLTLAVALAIGLVGSAAAQDRLKPLSRNLPEVSIQYGANLHRAFHEAFDADVLARVLFLPSFEPEEAIGLRKRGGVYEVFTLSAAQLIWAYSDPAAAAQAGLPTRPEDVPLTRCTITLDAAPAEAILQAWRAMLGEVRAEDGPTLGVDGETYDFTMPGPDGERSGEALSPHPATRVGTLVRLAEAMRDYCQTGQKSNLSSLTALAGTLSR
jgi:hypothetical protein